MSRESRIARTVRRALDRRLKDWPTNQNRRPIKRVLNGVLTLVGLAASLVGLMQLLPRVSISPQSPLISSNAFSAPFLVSNDGYIRLNKVNAICSPKNIIYTDDAHKDHHLVVEQDGPDELETGGLYNPSLEAAQLLPGHKLVFPCGMLDMPFADRVSSAHIVMIVTFRAPVLSYPRFHRQRFELTRDSSGQYHWLEEASR